MDHCCFAGCKPLECGCCANMIGHEESCPKNYVNEMAQLAGKMARERGEPRVPSKFCTGYSVQFWEKGWDEASQSEEAS